MQGFTSVQKMAEDSTPVPSGSLNKCFAEQHDIANGSFTQWCFDQQQNDLKQLTVQYEDLEDKVELVECFYTQLDGNQEENRGNLEKLEKRVTQLEVDLESESELFEERLATLKTENAELRIHLNLVVDAVNNITRTWNEACSNNESKKRNLQDDTVSSSSDVEPTVSGEDDDEPTMEDNEPPQLTLRQVYDMYQSQPPDEEGWDEMTKAIEAAEEYEATLQKQQQGLSTSVNGMTYNVYR